MLILVADDDHDIVDLLAIYLKNESYDVLKAYDGMEALNHFRTHPQIDLAILDIMMPKMEGIEVLETIRRENMKTPVIIVSAKSGDVQKIEGLIAGADDYVTKPFNPLEVVARVKSILRRQNEYTQPSPSTQQMEVGPLIIDREAHHVETLEGIEIQLTGLEFGILALLAAHPGRVFSADEIFQEVWQQESPMSARTVMVHMSHLREKIAEATGGNKVIETVWGVGYKVEG